MIKMNRLEFNTTEVLFLLLYFIFCSMSIMASKTSPIDIEVADQLKEMRLELNQLNRKSGLLELKNVRQDGEIRFLKTLVSSIVFQTSNSTMQKRAARLIPAQLLMNRGEEGKPIVGPPSSCKDLNQLGHTLNGIYLIRTNRSTSTNSKTINAVFCDFQPKSGAQKSSSSSPTFIESRLGYVDVKSAKSGIHFYVQIGNRTFPEKGVLRFDHQVLNVGGGMDLKTGVFTAPKAGVYSFSFSIMKSGYALDHVVIHLRLNSAKLGLSGAGVGLTSNAANLQSILKMKKGDRIDLWKSRGEVNRQFIDYCNHFTGSLLEEDLPEIM